MYSRIADGTHLGMPRPAISTFAETRFPPTITDNVNRMPPMITFQPDHTATSMAWEINCLTPPP